MKIERKSNSQIRKDKESLVMENFKSVMKKLDDTFLKEDMPVDYVKDPNGNMVGTKRHGAGFVPSEKGVEQGYKPDKDAPNDAKVDNKDLKRDVSNFLDKLNIKSVENVIDRIDTPAEQAEVMTQFAIRLGIDPNKLPFIFSQIKGKVKN